MSVRCRFFDAPCAMRYALCHYYYAAVTLIILCAAIAFRAADYAADYFRAADARFHMPMPPLFSLMRQDAMIFMRL